MSFRLRVYVEVGNTPPMAAGKAITDLLQSLGAEPFLAPPSHGDLQVSWEELMEFDPQVVIYAVKGKGLMVDPADFLKIEGWDRTEAAAKRQVFSLDDALLRPDQLAQGALLLQALLAELGEGGPGVVSTQLRRLSPNSK